MDLTRLIARAVQPLKTRLLLLLGRALISAASEQGGLGRAQVLGLDNELLEEVENPQHYGFASLPLPGSEVFVGFLAGERGHGFLVATGDRRYRPRDLEPGEVVLFTKEDTLAEGEEAPEWYTPPEEGPAQGLCRIHFREGREIEIICNKLTLQVAGAPSEISGEEATGGIFEQLAQVGRDKIVIPIGDSAGTYYIERGP